MDRTRLYINANNEVKFQILGQKGDLVRDLTEEKEVD